jgi:hypothetical protein
MSPGKPGQPAICFRRSSSRGIAEFAAENKEGLAVNDQLRRAGLAIEMRNVLRGEGPLSEHTC